MSNNNWDEEDDDFDTDIDNSDGSDLVRSYGKQSVRMKNVLKNSQSNLRYFPRRSVSQPLRKSLKRRA